MANTFRKIYKKTGSTGTSSDYQIDRVGKSYSIYFNTD